MVVPDGRGGSYEPGTPVFAWMGGGGHLSERALDGGGGEEGRLHRKEVGVEEGGSAAVGHPLWPAPPSPRTF